MGTTLETLRRLGIIDGKDDIERLGRLTKMAPDTLLILTGSRKSSPRVSLKEILENPTHNFGPRNRRRRRF